MAVYETRRYGHTRSVNDACCLIRLELTDTGNGLAANRQIELLPVATGTVIHEVGSRNGEGELRIENGLDLDAVAVLSRIDGASVVAIYVLNHGNFTITGIQDGTYELYFTLGEDWDSERTRFTRRRSLSRFDDPFGFTTTATTYTAWTVTLHPVEGGTAETEPVPEDEFPDLK